MEIDWSKAPKGTTHYYKGSPHPWRDLSGFNWKYFMNGEWYLCPSCCTSDELMRELGKLLFERPLPQVSNGEGMPPVGTVCEVIPHNTLWGFSVLGNYSCTILAYHDDFVWIDLGVQGVPVSTRIDKVDFRPIRTAEQIAAEKEQYDFFDQMDQDLGEITDREVMRKLAGYLWKAGYRKQASE